MFGLNEPVQGLCKSFFVWFVLDKTLPVSACVPYVTNWFCFQYHIMTFRYLFGVIARTCCSKPHQVSRLTIASIRGCWIWINFHCTNSYAPASVLLVKVKKWTIGAQKKSQSCLFLSPAYYNRCGLLPQITVMLSPKLFFQTADSSTTTLWSPSSVVSATCYHTCASALCSTQVSFEVHLFGDDYHPNSSSKCLKESAGAQLSVSWISMYPKSP